MNDLQKVSDVVSSLQQKNDQRQHAHHTRASTLNHPWLGSLGLLFSAALVCLALVDETAGLPFRMPRSWYASRPLWYFITVVSFLCGFLLLRNPRRFSDSWSAEKAGIRFERVLLYTRGDCHLCDHAKDTLLKYRRYLPKIDEVDIESDSELVDRFGTCIPVVEIDGRIRFRGEVNELLLRRMIDRTPPRG